MTVTPTVESTGLQAAFDRIMQVNEDWPALIENITTGIAPPEFFTPLDEALQLLDPDYIHPSKFKTTFHTGKFVSNVNEDIILPEFRDILVRRTTNWQDGFKITFEIENRGGGSAWRSG